MGKRVFMGVVVAALGAGLALGGCERDQKAYGVDRDRGTKTAEPSQERRDTSGVRGSANFAGAVNSIAQARCAREEHCKNIGPDHKYKTKEACVSAVTKENADDLNAEECKGGIDQKELNDCIEAIHKEECNNPLDALGRLAACRTSAMCKSTTGH